MNFLSVIDKCGRSSELSSSPPSTANSRSDLELAREEASELCAQRSDPLIASLSRSSYPVMTGLGPSLLVPLYALRLGKTGSPTGVVRELGGLEGGAKSIGEGDCE